MAVNGSFWKGKSVFLTGHTGFKGGWLALWLKRLGADVSGFALAPSHENGIFAAARTGDGVISTIADIREPGRLKDAMADVSPEIAFHFAAQPLVRSSYASPAETFDVNVMGTVNFLESVRSTPSIRAAVIVTSDKCYENKEWCWGYRENDPMGGDDPYSSSKGCAELVTASYRRSFLAESGVAVASVRAGNVIGGGDWADARLIPDMVKAWSRRQCLSIRYPNAIRPWQHVLEPLRGYMMLGERLWKDGADFAEAWNFGPRDEDAWPVGRVVDKGSQLWGDGAAWETDARQHPHEARFLKLDCSKSRARLGWFPALSLETALDWTIAWYRRQHAGNVDMNDFTQNQIKRYEELVAMSGAVPPFSLGADGE